MIGEVGRCQVTKDLVPMIRSLNLAHWYDMETPPFTPSHWPRNPCTLNLEFKVYYWGILFFFLFFFLLGHSFQLQFSLLFSTLPYFGVLALFFSPFIPIVELLAYRSADQSCLTQNRSWGRLAQVLVIVKCALQCSKGRGWKRLVFKRVICSKR